MSKISGEQFLADLEEGVEALAAYRQGIDSVRVSRAGDVTPLYAMIVQETALGWVATIPDVPGCLATGATRAEAEASVMTLLSGYAERETLPPPRSFVRSVAVPMRPKL